MSLVLADPKTAAQQPALVDRLARRAFVGLLSRLEEGVLTLVDGSGRSEWGKPSPDGLAATLEVRDPAFFRSVLLGGTLGAAEAYLDGMWETDDLVALVRLLARNRGALEGVDGGLAWLGQLSSRLLHILRANSRGGSRRNIRAHYDLGNDLFAAFLDPSMTYSSADFADEGASLEEAQRAKIDRICRKLRLEPSDHLLEIGTGWGALAIHAASRYGCRVTTTTISDAQHEEATRRVEAAGLSGRITLLKRDYRDLEGSFDKIVSVEMVEAVGLARLPGFFEKCSRLLRPEGLLALQSITIADRHYEEASRNVDFIQRYIFPGGALPSVSSLLWAATERSPLTPMHVEETGLHYAETLRRWRERFEEAWPGLEGWRYDERFRRLWRYYLAYCEGGFRERVIGVVQLLLAGPAFRGETLRGELGR
jgi:cyclopropane-fatty-acyl-phospholipid synthase